ncbi:MAG: enoyl-CoA hydratase/isomerase family protein [Thermoleophilaceae bacterium]|nr:enoyl-CoA hydratase/isomerase family protein [Thermoleophilaceae bacterium]
MGLVTVEDRGAVRHVVLNRADKRNSFNSELVLAVGDALGEAANDTDVRVVIIRGEGPVFSAGMDIKELASLATTPERLREFRRSAIEAWNLAETMTKPTIAQIHGVCIGGAMELALACDLRVVTPDSRMSLPEVKLGLLPDVGGSSRLPAVVGLGIAKELILTGREFDGEEAGRIGFANRVVAADQLEAATTELADEIASNFATPVGLAKRVMDASARPALSTTLEMEVMAQEVSVAALAAAMRESTEQ